MTGEAFFTIVLCIWAEVFATSIVDYTPILIFSVITIVEIYE